MDELTLVITFKDQATRDAWGELCKELGHDEHELAKRLLTQFIGYCEEERPPHMQKEKK